MSGSKVSNQLHRLIHSLDKGEKRYFKVYAKRYDQLEGQLYIKMFDTIDKQAEYDQKKLIQKLKIKDKGTFVSVMKNYLYNLILESMQVYHSDRSKQREILSLFLNAEFLYHKGLFNDCYRLIQKAEAQAKKFGFPELSLIALNHEKSVLREMPEIEFTRHWSDLKDASDDIKFKQELYELFTKLKELHYVRNEGSKERISELLSQINESEWYNKELNSFNPIHQRAILEIKLFAQAISHPVNEETLHIMEQTSELFKKYPELIDRDPDTYFQTVQTNLCIAQYQNGNYEDCFNTIDTINEKIKGYRRKLSKRAVENVFFQTSILKINYYWKMGRLEEMNAYSKKLEDEITNYSDSAYADFRMIVLFHIAVSYFAIGENKSALKWVNQIVNNRHLEDIRRDVYRASKILFLIIHLEMGNQELLISAVRSTYRYLLNMNDLGKFQEIVLSLLRQIPKLTSRNELIDEFKRIRHLLSELSDDKSSHEDLEAFRIISWLDSKIEKRPFKEIVKAKVEQGIEF